MHIHTQAYVSALRHAKYFMLFGWVAMPAVWVLAALDMVDVTTEEVCMYICAYTCVCVYADVYVCVCVLCVCFCVSMCDCVALCLHTYSICVCGWVVMPAVWVLAASDMIDVTTDEVHICIYIYIYMCVCVCVCVCVYVCMYM